MSHWCRRKSFIVVQELNELKNTKDLLSSKLNLLINQLLLCLNSVNQGDLVSPEFSKGLSLSIGLEVKILQTLLHLSNSSQLCWAFLQTLEVKEQQSHIFGSLKISGFLIDTDKILKDLNQYLLSLFGLGIVDISTWQNLINLKNRNSSEGFLSLNDSYYYERKKFSIFEPLEGLERFDQFAHDLGVFMNNSMKLRNPTPILYPCIKLTEQKKNLSIIKDFLNHHSFDYINIRKDKELKNTLDLHQHQSLMDALSYLNSISNLYRATAEFKLVNTSSVSRELFSCMLDYFFHQSAETFNFESCQSQKRCFMERVVSASLCLDFILCVCENSVSCSFTKKLGYDVAYENFVKFCETELFVLNDSQSMHMMMLFDFDSLELIIKQISKLKENPFYKKYYARIMDKYLDVGGSKKT